MSGRNFGTDDIRNSRPRVTIQANTTSNQNGSSFGIKECARFITSSFSNEKRKLERDWNCLKINRRKNGYHRGESESVPPQNAADIA